MSNEQEKIKWPSERIPQGGIFQSKKVVYSKETSDLLKLLMQESKMSMMIRSQINYHLRNGDPLPLPPQDPRGNNNLDDNAKAKEIIQRARIERRKTLDSIVASGAYEQPRYRTRPILKTPSEQAKLQLQEAMCGQRLSTTNLKPKRKPPIEDLTSAQPENMINDYLDQINERAEWLAEMEELGQGKKYRDEIHSQIAERLRKIKILENRLKMLAEGYRFVN